MHSGNYSRLNSGKRKKIMQKNDKKEGNIRENTKLCGKTKTQLNCNGSYNGEGANALSELLNPCRKNIYVKI